jgi:hypothetical protein
MNYSFVDKYKSKDFVPTNPSNLYNEYTPDKKFNPSNYYMTGYLQNQNNWATENSIQKTLLQGTQTPTPLGELFFSPENINRLQQMVKYEVFLRTNGKYKLEIDQNESDLLVVMRAVYISDAMNQPYRLVHQVKILNHRTIERIVPDMISMIKQDDEYVKQLDRPLDPIPLPVNVNNAGRLALPSVTTTFFPPNGVFN